MKSFALMISVALVAGYVSAGVVTQTVSAVSDNLPITGDQFQKQINTAVHCLATDVSNLVMQVNSQAQYGVFTNTFSAANMTAGTAASAINGAAITNLAPANLSGTKLTQVITNASTLMTNVTTYVNGVATANTHTP